MGGGGTGGLVPSRALKSKMTIGRVMDDTLSQKNKYHGNYLSVNSLQFIIHPSQWYECTKYI